MSDAKAIVAGAGPAGLMTALTLARRGLSVIVVEKRPRERLAKPIRVAVEDEAFVETGLAAPAPPELAAGSRSREVVSPDGQGRLNLRPVPLAMIDLRALTTRLVELCEQAGVRLMFETDVAGPALEPGRVGGVVATTAESRPLKLSAPLSIDATGTNGALRHHLDATLGVTRELNPRDLVDVWQTVFELDHDAARSLSDLGRLRPQTNVIRLGAYGPFSAMSIFVDLEADRVEVSAGKLHALNGPTAKDLVEGYAESHNWVGPPISRAGGLVPTRRPLDTMVAHGFACVGDAACMASPLTAKGVASALIGGKLLGETAATALIKGAANREALWPYNVKFIEARGAAHANADLFRRFIIGLADDEAQAVFGKSLINEDAIGGAFQDLALELPANALLAGSLSLWRRPRLLGRLFKLGHAAGRALSLYASYPLDPDPDAFLEWRRRADKLFEK